MTYFITALENTEAKLIVSETRTTDKAIGGVGGPASPLPRLFGHPPRGALNHQLSPPGS